jgi:hypothetical protein
VSPRAPARAVEADVVVVEHEVEVVLEGDGAETVDPLGDRR